MKSFWAVLLGTFFICHALLANEPYPMDQNAHKWDQSDVTTKWGDNYLIGTLEPQKFSYDRITHILVPGSAMGDESDQFFQTTLLRAKLYQKLYPTHQVVIISQPDVIKASQEEVFARFNLPIIENVDDKLTAGQLLSQMLKFKKIASFDFYGHSSPWALRLGKKDASMYASEGFAKLKSRFVEGAYGTLNGCNGGFVLAPALSKLWGIPVSGALTGSLFERLQADGKWYKKSDRTRSEWSSENAINFENPQSCNTDGVCWRMKPQRYNYGSYWGSFKEGGLSFYKFFCNYNDTNNSCLKGLGKSMLSFQAVAPVSTKPSWEIYEAKVFDYLCSTNKSPNYFDSCVEGIKAAVARGDNVFQAHPGNALHCDFKKCHAKVVCKQKRFFGSGPKPGTCRLDTKVNSRPTTIVREYLAYKKAFDLL